MSVKSPKTKRLHQIILWGIFISGAFLFIFGALEENIMYFLTPTEFLEKPFKKDKIYRIGGIVQKGSIIKAPKKMETIFKVSDTKQALTVKFKGIPPDLFQEGKGVIAEGKYLDGIFVATKILAKHDENYTPLSFKEKEGFKSKQTLN